MSNFTHLHVASAYSGHYGVTRPELLAQAASSQGSGAHSITDRDGLYGSIKHIGACLQLGIDPIVGVDLLVLDDLGEPLARCVILAHGNNKGLGWKTLCQVVSTAHKNGKRKAIVGIKRSELAQLIQSPEREMAFCTVLLGPDSDLGRLTLAGRKIEAEASLAAWRQALSCKGALAIEVVSHLTEPGSDFSVIQAKRMLQIADSFSVPTVLTNAVRYLNPDDALTADVLDAARHLEPLGYFQPQPNAQAWLKPTRLMQDVALEITQDYQRSIKLLETTSQLTDRCRLDPVNDCGWGKPKTPEKSALGIEGNPFEVLWQKAHDGIDWRYRDASSKQKLQVQHRLSQELITINKLGFATYFLTVADVAQMIRDMKIRSAARGSGAGSLVNYLLGISGVDPIEHDLLFERFLSTERSSLPDIDIDVESARRHEIYRAIFKRYGSERVTLL